MAVAAAASEDPSVGGDLAVDLVDHLGHSLRSATSVESRIKLYSSAEGASMPASVSDVLEFPFPGSYDLDPSTMYLNFKGVSASAASGATPFLPNGGMIMAIESIEFRIDSQSIWKVQGFDLAYMLRYQMDGDMDMGAPELYGIGPQSDRITWSASGRDYIVPLSALFSNASFLPRHVVWGRSDLRLIVHLKTAEAFLEATAASTTPTISITNAFLECDGVRMSHSFINSYRMLATQGIPFYFNLWAFGQFNVPSGATSLDLDIPVRKGSVRRVLAVLRDTSELNTVTVLNRQERWDIDNVSSFVWDFNGHRAPQRPLLTSASEIYSTYHNFLQDSHGRKTVWPAHWETNVDFDSFRGAAGHGIYKFIMSLDMRRDGRDHVLSGVKTSGAADSLRLIITSDSGMSDAYNLQYIVEHDIEMRIFADGSVRVGQ